MKINTLDNFISIFYAIKTHILKYIHTFKGGIIIKY